jgi:hypothetical protein
VVVPTAVGITNHNQNEVRQFEMRPPGSCCWKCLLLFSGFIRPNGKVFRLPGAYLPLNTTPENTICALYCCKSN